MIGDKLNNLIQLTNGKKTTTVSIVSVLFEALMLWKPDMIGENEAAPIRLIINSGLLTALAHKAWRNRKQVGNFFSNLFKKKDDTE